MRLRSKFAVKCAKATSSLIKKLNRGSGVTLPGYVARLIDPNILKELSGQVRKKTIVTMGTNGKTTTNAILCKALEHEGQKVIINRTGANTVSYTHLDVQKIIADKTSDNGAERTFRCQFNLKSLKYSNTATYYLVIADVQGLQLPQREPFQIDIAFAVDEFDFFS